MYCKLHAQLKDELESLVKEFSARHGLVEFDPKSMDQSPMNFQEIVTMLLCFGCNRWPAGCNDNLESLGQCKCRGENSEILGSDGETLC